MSRLEHSLVKAFEMCDLKNEQVKSQNYAAAASTREVERALFRDAWESCNGTCPTGLDWEKYESWAREYCLEKYGVESITTVSLREVKLRDLGI